MGATTNGHNGHDGHGPGATEDAQGLFEGRAPIEVDDPPPEVAELATACERFVSKQYGVKLDFTSDTLPLVDRWLLDSRAEARAKAEVIELVQAAAGAYLGEVMRRTFGGDWVARGDHAEWRLCLSHVYCAFNPMGMAREAILVGPAEGWHAHFELDPGERDDVERRLEGLPPVSDDDFYAPSTRFDVLESVFEMLRARMRERGLEDVRFAPSDYE